MLQPLHEVDLRTEQGTGYESCSEIPFTAYTSTRVRTEYGTSMLPNSAKNKRFLLVAQSSILSGKTGRAWLEVSPSGALPGRTDYEEEHLRPAPGRITLFPTKLTLAVCSNETERSIAVVCSKIGTNQSLVSVVFQLSITSHPPCSYRDTEPWRAA